MGKVKIHEIAKKLNLTSKEVLERATELKIDAKNHLSSIEDFEAEKLTKSFDKNNVSKEKNQVKEVKKDNKNKRDEKTPVIIRREVIVSENEKNTKKEENEHIKRKEQVGFVERRKQNDYNIVYRNKTTKPMTVNELFGIGKKEESLKETKNQKDTELHNEKPIVQKEIEKIVAKEEMPKQESKEITKESHEEVKKEIKQERYMRICEMEK